MNCCPGVGRNKIRQSPLVRPDHARQQSLSVTTIDRVAADLGESVDWLFEVAGEMDTEDGVIWIRGLGEDAVIAFTDFGIETLIELIKIHKNDPTPLQG
jgi:hypothetical protein